MINQQVPFHAITDFVVVSESKAVLPFVKYHQVLIHPLLMDNIVKSRSKLMAPGLC